MATECMLTTVDNPYDPFEQFTLWFLFDVGKGYNSCGRLARLVNLSDDMSSVEVDEEIDKAIDKLIKLDCLDLYKKAYKKNNVAMTN